MKKLFNIIALSLAFAPALRGTVQEDVNELKQLIAVTDAQAFEKPFTTFLGSEIAKEDRYDALAELEQHTQEVRQQLQDQLASMGNATTDKMTLVKGFAQAITAGALGIGAVGLLANATLSPLNSLVLKYDNNTFLNKLSYLYLPTRNLSKWLAHCLGYDFEAVDSFCYKVDYHNNGTVKRRCYKPVFNQESRTNVVIALAHVAAGAYLSSLGFKNGIQNIKKGLDLKKHLELQITSLDEIIACIQRAKNTVD